MRLPKTSNDTTTGNVGSHQLKNRAESNTQNSCSLIAFRSQFAILCSLPARPF